MTGQSVAKLGGSTIVLNGTSTTQNKGLGFTNSRNLIIYNASSTDSIFINDVPASTATTVFPTTGASQVGAIVAPGATVTYEKNNANNGFITYICDAGKTVTAYVQTADGE